MRAPGRVNIELLFVAMEVAAALPPHRHAWGFFNQPPLQVALGKIRAAMGVVGVSRPEGIGRGWPEVLESAIRRIGSRSSKKSPS
jgi:hypothetical protein